MQAVPRAFIEIRMVGHPDRGREAPGLSTGAFEQPEEIRRHQSDHERHDDESHEIAMRAVQHPTQISG